MAVPTARAAEDILSCSNPRLNYPFDFSPLSDGEMKVQPITASITDSRNITFVMFESYQCHVTCRTAQLTSHQTSPDENSFRFNIFIHILKRRQLRRASVNLLKCTKERLEAHRRSSNTLLCTAEPQQQQQRAVVGTSSGRRGCSSESWSYIALL